MKQRVIICAAVTVFFVGICWEVSAGLINYDRRKGDVGGKRTAANTPAWAKEAPRVTNKVERRYDINRDGKLQTAEVKIFLRDVVDEIEDRGRYPVQNSDILKEYDKNKDRIINKYELADLIKDVR